MLLTLVTIVHIAVCTMLILIVLLQQGKGADMGATFGGGSNTLFGASGADNLLSRVTTVTAFIFMCTSVFLAQSARPGAAASGNLFQNIPEQNPPPLTMPLDANTGAPIAPPAAGGAPAGGQASGTVADGAAAPNTQAQPAPAADANVPAAPATAEAPKTEAPAAAPAAPPAAAPQAGPVGNAPAGANP